jgi:exosortase B
MSAATQTASGAMSKQDLSASKWQAQLAWICVLLGLVGMYGPSFWDLLHGVWATDKQGHGPVVLAISLWLLWRKRAELSVLAPQPRNFLGGLLFVFALLLYIIGRSQDILTFEIGSFILTLLALLLLYKGPAAIKISWFALFFMLFMIPLPGELVDTLTQPLKLAVSTVTEHILYGAGYPISRTGVILQIGQYQLLVADACAGLNTLFTLEALGLLYLNMVHHDSAARNFILALLIVPISFSANVIRVMTLTLITYYFGDEAGQGFLHGFAGMVLFMVALLLITTVDSLLQRLFKVPSNPNNLKLTAEA